jgi:hypothetical protein
MAQSVYYVRLFSCITHVVVFMFTGSSNDRTVMSSQCSTAKICIVALSLAFPLVCSNHSFRPHLSFVLAHNLFSSLRHDHEMWQIGGTMAVFKVVLKIQQLLAVR